jgi:hypothetical protein
MVASVVLAVVFLDYQKLTARGDNGGWFNVCTLTAPGAQNEAST